MLTKDSFSLTHFFNATKILKNTENYLYTIFSIKTNGVLVEYFVVISLNIVFSLGRYIVNHTPKIHSCVWGSD